MMIWTDTDTTGDKQNNKTKKNMQMIFFAYFFSLFSRRKIMKARFNIASVFARRQDSSRVREPSKTKLQRDRSIRRRAIQVAVFHQDRSRQRLWCHNRKGYNKNRLLLVSLWPANYSSCRAFCSSCRRFRVLQPFRQHRTEHTPCDLCMPCPLNTYMSSRRISISIHTSFHRIS